MGPAGPIFMVGVQVWPWKFWPGQDSAPMGVAAVWIAELFCSFITLLISTSGQAISGAITEVVIAGCRRISVFLFDAFLAGCTLQVEQHCQVLKHIFTSSVGVHRLRVTWVTV